MGKTPPKKRAKRPPQKKQNAPPKKSKTPQKRSSCTAVQLLLMIRPQTPLPYGRNWGIDSYLSFGKVGVNLFTINFLPFVTYVPTGSCFTSVPTALPSSV